MIDLISVALAIWPLLLLFCIIFAGSFGMSGGMVAMLSAGALADNTQSLAIIIAIAICAAIIGDILAYELARRFSDPLQRRLRRFKAYEKNEDKAKVSLNKSGFFYVFTTRFFFTTFGAPVTYISGFEKMDRKRFIPAVIAGEMIYGSIYPILGFMFKETWADLYNVIANMALAIALVVIAVLVIRWRINSRKQVDKNNDNN